MSINLDYDNYETKIQSFTHKKIYNVIVSKSSSPRRTTSSSSTTSLPTAAP